MKMIEKVARAIHDSAIIRMGWDTLNISEKESYFACARAAIQAMHEPTEEMLKAFYGDMPIEQWLGNDWRDMIDAALKE